MVLQVVVSLPSSVTFVGSCKKNYVTEIQIANKFVFSDLYVAILCNLGFTMRGS